MLGGAGRMRGLTWCVTTPGIPPIYASQRAKDWLEQHAGYWLRLADMPAPANYPASERDGMCWAWVARAIVRLASCTEQQQAEGFVEGLVPIGQQRAEEGPLGGGQDGALGRSVRERQPDERGEIAVVGERVRRSG